MSFPPGLGGKPPWVTADAHFEAWFSQLAGRLLNACDLVVAGDRYRFAELEMYYSGEPHPDPFAHRDPLQRENARWYFHRTRGEYRGGSFKGLDLTLGDGTAFFGILVRTVVGPDGTVVSGPSLTVDHLLARTKAAGVAALDGIIAGRKVWDAASPLAVVEAETPRTAAVFPSARVGLSLKKAKGQPDALRFVGRAYRFLTEPRVISKGKPHLVLALHRKGETPAAIARITGCPERTVAGYVEHFVNAHADPWESYIGRDLSTGQLCAMLGTWAAKFGGEAGA